MHSFRVDSGVAGHGDVAFSVNWVHDQQTHRI